MIIAMLQLTARGCRGERREGGSWKREEWMTLANNDGFVAATLDAAGWAEVQTGAARFFGIDYSSVLLYI